MSKNDTITPFNKYYFLNKVETAGPRKQDFYVPDSARNGNYEIYKVLKTPTDASLQLENADQVLVMQSMVESAKVLDDMFFCPESAIICKL